MLNLTQSTKLVKDPSILTMSSTSSLLIVTLASSFSLENITTNNYNHHSHTVCFAEYGPALNFQTTSSFCWQIMPINSNLLHCASTIKCLMCQHGYKLQSDISWYILKNQSHRWQLRSIFMGWIWIWTCYHRTDN